MRKIFYIFLFSGILNLVLFLITVDISLGALPLVPQLKSPSAGATVSVTPTFRWSDVKAEWYHLYFNSSVWSNLTDTSYTFSSEEALPPQTTYIWSVRACNSGLVGPECTDSVTRSFTTRAGGGSSQVVEIINPLEYEELGPLLEAITDFIRNLALVVAPIMLVISGLLFVTSAGDPGRVQTAKKLALYTVIGLAIILLASGLVAVLKSAMGVTGS